MHAQASQVITDSKFTSLRLLFIESSNFVYEMAHISYIEKHIVKANPVSGLFLPLVYKVIKTVFGYGHSVPPDVVTLACIWVMAISWLLPCFTTPSTE